MDSPPPISLSRPKHHKFLPSGIVESSKKMFKPIRRKYLSVNTPPEPSPLQGTLKIPIGADSSTRRSWILPKALLAHHSTSFAKECADPYKNATRRTFVDSRAFANFVDCMRSSIYSLNEKVAVFSRIRAHTKANLLGIDLGARDYANAAITQLSMMFEPLARLRTSNRAMSCIHASDVAFICAKAKFGMGRLRQLFCDAEASHWRQREAFDVGSEKDLEGDTISWGDVYEAHDAFRETLVGSVRVMDNERIGLLGHLTQYLLSELPLGKNSGRSGNGIASFGTVGRGLVASKTRIPSLMRSGDMEKRRREREKDVGED